MPDTQSSPSYFMTYASTFPDITRTLDGTAHGESMPDGTIEVVLDRACDTVANVMLNLYVPSEAELDSPVPFMSWPQGVIEDEPGALDERMATLCEWAGDVVDAVMDLPDEYVEAYRADLERHAMPKTVEFDNGLTLSRIDAFEPRAMGEIDAKAATYIAMTLFDGLAAGEVDMAEIDRASIVQGDVLMLGDYEGYTDGEGDVYARAVAVDAHDAFAVECADTETGDHLAWYVRK